MNNKLMKKLSVLTMTVLVSVSVVGCGDVKVGGEKLPISGIEEFESYELRTYIDSKCVGCAKKKIYYNTNIGKMCKKCYSRYEKYINKLAKRTQTCGKCQAVPTIVIEHDRYHNPTEVSCSECVVIYEEEATDRMMKETIEKADLDKEFVRLAKKQAREDKQQLTGTPEEMTQQAMMLADNFANTVIARYALGEIDQQAMMYIYMIELSK